MVRLRLIGLALLTPLALGALAASITSAEEGISPSSVTGSGEGGEATLETTNKEKLTFASVPFLLVTFTTSQKGTATLHFTGCLLEGIFPCNSLGDASGVVLIKINTLVCLVEPKNLVFGLLIQPGTIEHIEVPAIAELILLKGSLIARLSNGNRGSTFLFLLKGKEGKQTEATECEINGSKFTHSFEFVNDMKLPDFKASHTLHFTITLNKEVEFVDK
jgi:hypothetical protein